MEIFPIFFQTFDTTLDLETNTFWTGFAQAVKHPIAA
jgi:hypothetical protein